MFAPLLAAAASAGPWVKDAGHAYIKAGYAQFRADTFVQPDGSEVQGTQYIGNTQHLYGEIGVGPGVQVVLNAPFVGSRNIIDGVSYINRWGGDLSVGLQAGRTLADLPVSLKVLSKLPLYDNADLDQYGISASRFPALGDGQVDVATIAAVGSGVSVGQLKGWVAAEAGYLVRTEWWMGDSSSPDREYVNGIPWNTQLGWSPSLRERELGWLYVSAGGVNNLTEDADTKQYIQGSVGGGLQLVKGFVAEVGYSSTLWTRASSPGGGISAGLSWSR